MDLQLLTLSFAAIALLSTIYSLTIYLQHERETRKKEAQIQEANRIIEQALKIDPSQYGYSDTR